MWHPLEKKWPIGSLVRIMHDGFEGEVIGYYTRKDGYQGVVLQQIGTRVVHVYGKRWLKQGGEGAENSVE